MLANVRGNLKDTCVRFKCFSLTLDKSTDLKDTAKRAVFMQKVMPSLVIEESVQLILLKGITTQKDLPKVLQTGNLIFQN